MAITITKPTVGGSEDSWGTTINTALDTIVLEINSNADGTNTVTPNLAAGWEVGGVAVTSTAAELNILDGVTATAAVIQRPHPQQLLMLTALYLMTMAQ